MTKAIFILESLTKEKIETAVSMGANAIFTNINNLTPDHYNVLKHCSVKIFVEVGLFQGEDLWKKYPDSQPVDRNGKLMEKIHWYAGVCPNNHRVRQKILTSINRLIEVYIIDGLWLDFIRYPCYWEEVRNSNITEYCFCHNCLEKFKKDIGGKPEGKKWIEWKCQQITDFVADVSHVIKNVGNGLKPFPILGIFAVPWQNNEFNGAIKRIIGQDFEQLSKYIDVFSPMTYQKFCERSTFWISQTIKYFSRITNKPVLPIIQTEDKAGKIGEKEFKEEVENALKLPSSGVIIFFLEDLLKDKNKVEMVKKFFKN